MLFRLDAQWFSSYCIVLRCRAKKFLAMNAAQSERNVAGRAHGHLCCKIEAAS